MASASPFEAEGKEWEDISPGVRRRIIRSDKRLMIVPEDPVQAQQRLLRELINALPDGEFARYVLTTHGSKGLHRADDFARARRYIREYPRAGEYDSPLQWAISRDTTELLEKLMGGRDYNDKEYKKGTPFDANTVCSNLTALYHAVSHHKVHNIHLLLKSGADPSIYSVYENSNDDDPWQTPLHRAAAQWHLDSIKLLLDHNADVNALSLLKGETPLHHALLSARFWAQKHDWPALKSTVECLTVAGANVNIRDDTLRSPLDIWLALASDYDNEEMAQITKLILEAGADVNAVGSEGYSSFLLAAAIDGPSNLFRILCSTGDPDLNQRDRDGDTALHLVARRGALDDVNMLLKAGADPNIRGDGGETPLHIAACRRGYHEIVKSLLAHADPTIPREDGVTAIDLAMMAGGITETMELFRGNGISLATIVLGWEGLQGLAHANGTSLPRFNELVLGPEARFLSHATTEPGLSRASSSLSTSAPDHAGPSATAQCAHAETAAFVKSASVFDTLENATLSDDSGKVVPKRLLDVTTGKFVSGDSSMKYVIGSYLWSPEKTPGLPLDPDGYETIPETSQRVDEACRKYPDLIELALPETEGMSALEYPTKDLYPSKPEAVYLTEVYQLLGREARRRGLRFVWIDSFCINQNDSADKAEQIPLMADYYRNAECCVVVSGSLRLQIRPELDPSREFFDSGDSVTDRILGWAIGFHYNRVWCLQETRLAKEVVTRSGSVRIKTSEVLAQKFDKHSADVNKLWRHSVREMEPVNRTRNAIIKANQQLPLAESRIDGGPPISSDFCMMLLRDRDSLYRHDRIFGALGLFPEAVRKSVPIDYSLSLGAVYAIFTYLRIRSGDLIGLLSVRAPDQAPHHIRDAPSWLPSGYGFNYADVLDLQTDPAANFRAGSGGNLNLQMIFIRIADCYQMKDLGSGRGQNSQHGNILLTLMNRDGSLLPGYRRAAVEPVEPDYRLTSDRHFGTSTVTVMGPPIRPAQLSPLAAQQVAAERERRRLQIQIAARQDRAVIAMLGIDKRTIREGFSRNTIWLILCTDDEGRTWRRHGIIIMTREVAECSIGAEGTESKDFCIV